MKYATAKEVSEYLAKAFQPDDQIIATWFSVEDVRLAVENEDVRDADAREWAEAHADELWEEFHSYEGAMWCFERLFELFREDMVRFIEEKYEEAQRKGEVL